MKIQNQIVINLFNYPLTKVYLNLNQDAFMHNNILQLYNKSMLYIGYTKIKTQTNPKFEIIFK